jgi:hypothetical protein
MDFQIKKHVLINLKTQIKIKYFKITKLDFFSLHREV